MILEDFPDYCLLEVLERMSPDQLVKMQRVNRRLNRLAVEKMRTKIKAITLNKSNVLFADCAHLGSIRQDQVLVLGPKFYHHPLDGTVSRKALLMSVLDKCTGVKSIDFAGCELNSNYLLEVFKRCPELECVKFVPWVISRGKKDWEQALDQIGHKIVHFARNRTSEESHYLLSAAQRLKMIVAKCPNIKRLDWVVDGSVDGKFMAAIKMLPKSCYVTIDCFNFGEDEDVDYFDDDSFYDGWFDYADKNFFKDVDEEVDEDKENDKEKEEFSGDFFEYVDELAVETLNWSLFGDRVERLSSLKFKEIDNDNAADDDVKFVNLKKLEYDKLTSHIGAEEYLIASQFPRLEEYRFNVCPGLIEEDYDALFQRIATVKKLSILCKKDCWATNQLMRFPQSAIHQLKNLDTIELNIIVEKSYGYKNVETKAILDQFEKYIDEISTLKNLTINLGNCKIDGWGKMVVDGFKRMKSEQNRVEIDLVYEE